MSPYIVSLTDHLIRKNGYDRLPSEGMTIILKHIALDLWSGDVLKMTPSKQGEIMAAFQTGDVMASQKGLFNLVSFSGDCGDLLRQLTSACLAYAICGRLFRPAEWGIPPYQRKESRKFRGESVNGSYVVPNNRGTYDVFGTMEP